jgi:hypothetical protein
LAPRTARAPVCGSASVTAAAEDVGHWNADDQGTSGVILFTFGGFERYELDHASAAHLTVLLCFAHCWHAVGTAAAKAHLSCSFRKEECCSMHTDRKRIDGAPIAFVVITLLTVIALEVLLSRLHAVF